MFLIPAVAGIGHDEGIQQLFRIYDGRNESRVLGFVEGRSESLLFEVGKNVEF